MNNFLQQKILGKFLLLGKYWSDKNTTFMKHSFTGSTLKISFYPFQQSNLSKSQWIQRIKYFFVTFSRVDYFSFYFFHEYIHGYSYLLTGQLTVVQ